jgi:hypothetical protein
MNDVGCPHTHLAHSTDAITAERDAALKEVARLQVQNVAPLVNKIDELQRENLRLQQTIDGWAGIMAAHQPSPAGAKLEPAKTYSYCGECVRLREALDKYGAHMVECSIADDGPCTCGYRAALSGGDGKTDRRSP